MNIVYFSSISGNTKRFVDRLEYEKQRIPLYPKDEFLYVTEPYILIVPTYGQSDNKAVPKQVIKFLNEKQNRDLCRGVVGTGNTNFGIEFGLAARIIAAKLSVPILGYVEIFGSVEDDEIITQKIKEIGDILD